MQILTERTNERRGAGEEKQRGGESPRELKLRRRGDEEANGTAKEAKSCVLYAIDFTAHPFSNEG